MSVWDALAYAADVAILGTYLALAAGRWREKWFHLANAIGCVPLIAVEALAGLWQPLILTAAFGLIGWIGLVRDYRAGAAYDCGVICWLTDTRLCLKRR